MKTKATRFNVILIAIVFSLIGKVSNAQNWQCYVANDHLTSPTIFEFDVYLKQTSGTDTLLRTFQGCFTFNAAFINGAAITASYVAGTTQMINYGPGSVTFSAAASGFQIAANTGVSCTNGTPILGNGTPKLIGTYRMVATTGAFGCAPPNPNMVITGEAATGLSLRMAITKWNDITCVLGTNTSLASSNVAYTKFATQTQYTLVNNFVRNITANATSTQSCINTGTANSSFTPPGFTGEVISYLWSNAATTQNLTGLAPGIYTVTITNQNGCSSTASTEVGAVVVNAVASSTPSCGTTGTADVSVTPPGTYSYSWSNGATASNIINLAPGTYTVTVTDQGGCSGTSSTTVGDASFTASANSTASCTGNGTAGALPLTAGFSYLWSNGATTGNINNLSPGTYTVTVTNLQTTCTATASTIVDNGAITAGATSTPSCTAAAPSGTAQATSVPPTGVTYLWNTGATTQSLTLLPPGTYTVTVTNNIGGCTATATTTVGGPVTAGATATPSCGQNNGSATATPGAGVTYLWSTGATINPISNLAPGTYTVTVTITGGCTSTATAVVGGPVTASITPTASCSGTNGSANVTTTPPTGVTYLWSTGATTNPINNLTPGTYTVTVTNSAGGCTVSATTNISGPITASAVSTASCGQNNGTATANPASGVTYLWSNGNTARIISNLAPGIYTVTVTGNPGGCTSTATTTVSGPVVGAGATSSPSCGTNTGTASATPISGVSYVWSNGATTNPISGLAPNTYTVTITNNAGGCTATATTTVGGPIVAGATSTPSCTGTNGTATATPASGVNYSWSNGASTQIITGLTPGTYTVFVSGIGGGCSSSASTTVGGSLIASAIGTESCGTNGTATATPPGLAYLWSNGGTTQTINNLVPATYTVTVTGGGGCTATATAIVSFAGVVATATSTGASCAGGDGTASAGPSGNSYIWSNGATNQNIIGLNPGTYTVTVSNQAGCSSTASTTVASSTITATATSTDATCAGNDGTATAGPSGNSYLWSNAATTQTLSGLSPGTYTVTVTTPTQCTGSASTTVGTAGGSNQNPPGPISGPTLVCKGQHGVVYCVTPVPGATSYVWTLPNGVTGVSNGPCITLSFNSHWSSGLLCVSSVSTCGTSPQSCITITRVNNPPSTPGNISGPSSLCPNTCATYSVPAISNASSYLWTVTGGAYINSGQGTNIVEICAPSGYTGGTISVKANNCKGSSAKKTKSISGLTPAPKWYNKNKGDNDVMGVCAGSIHEYEIHLIPGVNCYIWTGPQGCIINDRAGHTGIGTLQTTGTVDDVDITFPAGFTSGLVTVAACGPCGPGAEAVLYVQSTPNTPGPISGWTSGVCGSGNRTYSVAPVPGATSYQWTLPSGVTLISGGTSRTIVVRFNNGFILGDLCVRAKNKCGYSDFRCITVDGLPVTPAMIFGHTSVCRTQTWVQYSIPSVQGAQSYNWTIDNGAQIVSGQGTNTIRVKYTNTIANPVTLSVVGTSPCGQTGLLTSTIIVNMNCKTSGDGAIVENQSPVMHSFNAYPNPTTGKTTVSFDADQQSKITLKVTDVIGNVLLVDVIAAVEGYNMKEINLEEFSAGLYFISVQVDGEQLQTLRLVVN